MTVLSSCGRDRTVVEFKCWLSNSPQVQSKQQQKMVFLRISWNFTKSRVQASNQLWYTLLWSRRRVKPRDARKRMGVLQEARSRDACSGLQPSVLLADTPRGKDNVHPSHAAPHSPSHMPPVTPHCHGHLCFLLGRHLQFL